MAGRKKPDLDKLTSIAQASKGLRVEQRKGFVKVCNKTCGLTPAVYIPRELHVGKFRLVGLIPPAGTKVHPIVSGTGAWEYRLVNQGKDAFEDTFVKVLAALSTAHKA